MTMANISHLSIILLYYKNQFKYSLWKYLPSKHRNCGNKIHSQEPGCENNPQRVATSTLPVQKSLSYSLFLLYFFWTLDHSFEIFDQNSVRGKQRSSI